MTYIGNQGAELTNLHPLMYPTMQLSMFFRRFMCVFFWTDFGMSDLLVCPMFRVDGWFSIRTILWLQCSIKLCSAQVKSLGKMVVKKSK